MEAVEAFEMDGHEAGNDDCPRCSPQRCDCGGLIHDEYLDESYDPETGDESVYYTYLCDQCGSANAP